MEEEQQQDREEATTFHFSRHAPQTTLSLSLWLAVCCRPKNIFHVLFITFKPHRSIHTHTESW